MISVQEFYRLKLIQKVTPFQFGPRSVLSVGPKSQPIHCELLMILTSTKQRCSITEVSGNHYHVMMVQLRQPLHVIFTLSCFIYWCRICVANKAISTAEMF